MAEDISDEEIQALLGAALDNKQRSGDDSLVNAPLSYDFKRPQRVNKDQLRVIESIHEQFARLFSSTLAGSMRMVVDVDLAFVDQVIYSEFIQSLSTPCSAYCFTMTPPDSPAVLCFAPELLMALVDRAFGGQGRGFDGEIRPLTQIENNIVNKLVNRVFVDLEATWDLATPVRIADVSVENNPEFIQIANSSDPAVVLAFEAHSNSVQGLIHLCYPLAAIEPLLPQLSPEFKQRARRQPDRPQEPDRSLNNVKVPVKVQIAQGSLPLRELADLRQGDVVQLDTGKDDPAIVFLGNQPKFLGRPGLDGKRRAVMIQRAIGADEEETYL